MAVDDLGLPTWCPAACVWPRSATTGTITLIANAVNWDGRDERVDEAYDAAVSRLDAMTRALGQPLGSHGGHLRPTAGTAPSTGGLQRRRGASGHETGGQGRLQVVPLQR